MVDFSNKSPTNVKQKNSNGKTKISWNTAYAADAPISHYEVLLNDQVIGKVNHHPQISKRNPFVFETEEISAGQIKVRTVDKAGNGA